MLGILITILGVGAYTVMGRLFMNIAYDHIKNLEKEVEKIDPRYCERLWYRISIKKTNLNQILMDLFFIIAWPAITIASILKAEWNYDVIVHHSAFERRSS